MIEVQSLYKVQLNFIEFLIEGFFDWVEIFDGPTLASRSIGQFSGSNKPSVLLSTSSIILIHLKSDKSTSDRGFFAHFKAGMLYMLYSHSHIFIYIYIHKYIYLFLNTFMHWITNLNAVAFFYASFFNIYFFFSVNEGCDTSLTINGTTFINSPKYPSNYPDNKKCTWVIKNKDPTKILTFQLFELETEENDFVEVRDGFSEDNVLLAKYYGNFFNQQKTTIFTTTSNMFVKFQSNFQINQKGFRAAIYSGI